MKKIISIILAIAFVAMLILPTSALAIPPKPNSSTLDISDYTLEDYLELDADEQMAFFYAFVDAYNPYGMRDKLEQINNETNIDTGISPQWSSGNNLNHTEQEPATHHLITLVAFKEFVNAHNFYKIDGAQALAISLYLMAASGLPDMDERDDDKFYSHFYDPDTGKNYDNQSDNTAKTKAEKHFDNAYNELRDDFFMDVTSDEFYYVLEELGRALHYIQDVCVPHHAANKTALNSNHALFELYVNNNLETILDANSSFPCKYHDVIQTNSVGYLVHKAAGIAKPKYENIKIIYSNKNVATSCIYESVYFSEALMLKLFRDARDYYDLWYT